MTAPSVTDVTDLVQIRVQRPEAIAEAAGRRRRRERLVGPSGRLMIIAADHPARGALRVGDAPNAMGDRLDLLQRLCLALSRPGVDGVLGTSDIIEDLLLLDMLHDKVVIGSMNRGGMDGTAFEMDDRFTGYDAEGIAAMGLDGGKMLLRIDPDDPLSVRTMHACALAVKGLAAEGKMVMIEPFICHRRDGRLRNDLSAEAMIRAISVGSGLGPTSARTWLKLPAVPEMDRVLRASTLPAMLLGGEVAADQEAAMAGWQQALRLPTVRGLVIGRSLLYPPNDDVCAAVDAAVALL